MFGLARLYRSGIAFEPDSDIPSLDGKVVLITGGGFCLTSAAQLQLL